ncbi:2-isopropylmalate synthase [Enterobacteriaceae endosymbiont of Plateumaris consimilis]|uniref:2-isopropylmalate synthase n=1 Tax=Enterobacteriaceae endosymbiont of Plateumaris consimilis TaxID=2675794 RepID=UPI001448D485|nr:2-isopropylmalate synthase [Enterobacteriaceae endosymbiont of Plateumaris consimilis]QJC28469.1 2-isopropylmalate synthase [Enterobacteriaceae endosymbiont of Plateumaris consimilis]
MKEKIIIFDTTLRDGEQSLKKSLNTQEKLKIALALELMGIDIIEVGFPISSPEDFKSCQKIAKVIKNSKICGLARCKEKDIDVAYEALKISSNFRIHIFLATSPIHIITKLKSTLNKIIERIIFMIKYAKKYTDDIEFSCEDAGRTPIKDLCLVVESAIKAGATTINIPDTVGYTFPNEYSNLIYNLKNNVSNIDQCIISVHTHNDLGMAVGNAITAINSGARQIEGTVNGIGERAGNCSLEEVIMALYTHKKDINFFTDINHYNIYNTSKIVSKICNIPIAFNKAIVGKNAFSHSSGIHQDGIIKNKYTYEILNPKIIGLNKTELNLTSKSGRAAIKYHMELMGYKNNNYDINKLYNDFVKLAEKKGQIFNYDLESLAFNSKFENSTEYYSLKKFCLQSKHNLTTTTTTTINLKLKCGNLVKSESAIDTNHIKAICKVINKITNYNFYIIKYKFHTQHYNKKIINQVNIKTLYKGKIFNGLEFSKDIIKASVAAIINIINSIWRFNQVENKNIKKYK